MRAQRVTFAICLGRSCSRERAYRPPQNKCLARIQPMPLYSALSSARSLKGSSDCDRMKARVAPHGVIHGAFMLCLLLRSVAGAVTFTVNSTADLPDAAINGTCAATGGACTLRAAI